MFSHELFHCMLSHTVRYGNEWISYCELRPVNDTELNVLKTAEYLSLKQWVSECPDAGARR